MEPFPLSESPRPAEKRASTGARLLNLYAMAAYKRGNKLETSITQAMIVNAPL